MSQCSNNPDLALSTEFGNGDFNRQLQVYGDAMFDWRDWVDNVEYEDFSELVTIPLAKARYDAVLASADKESALINFKLTVLEARVAHERPRPTDC